LLISTISIIDVVPQQLVSEHINFAALE